MKAERDLVGREADVTQRQMKPLPGYLPHGSFREHQSQSRLQCPLWWLMKAQIPSWARLPEGRIQKGILAAQHRQRASTCYRAGDPGTGRPPLHTATHRPGEWAWGLRHSRNRPKGIEVEELLSPWILETLWSKFIMFRWPDGKDSVGQTQ